MKNFKTLLSNVSALVIIALFFFFLTQSFGCKKSPISSSKPIPKPSISETLSQEEKNGINQQFFANTSFHEIDSLPKYIEQKLPFIPIRMYQKDQVIYFITAESLKNQDAESISSLKEHPEYGVCSEIWIWKIPNESLQKYLVKYDYYPNPHSPKGNKCNANMIVTSHGEISEITDIFDNGDIAFTESKSGGMMHFTTVEYIYHVLSNTISINSFQPGRPELYSKDEIQKKNEEIINTETLSLFRSVSDITWKKQCDNIHWSYFNQDRLYALQYNIKASKKENGEYYHEIGYFSLIDQSYHKIIKKLIPEFDTDPSIALELTPGNNNLSIHDWCGSSQEPRTNQKYYYNANENSIIYLEDSRNITYETGVYEVILNHP